MQGQKNIEHEKRECGRKTRNRVRDGLDRQTDLPCRGDKVQGHGNQAAMAIHALTIAEKKDDIINPVLALKLDKLKGTN